MEERATFTLTTLEKSQPESHRERRLSQTGGGSQALVRHPIRQVGNAVPPVLAAMVGRHAKKHLFGIDGETTYHDILRNLGLNYLLGSCPGFPSWLRELFQQLSREKDGKSALGLWRSVQGDIPNDPYRVNVPVVDQVAN